MNVKVTRQGDETGGKRSGGGMESGYGVVWGWKERETEREGGVV